MGGYGPPARPRLLSGKEGVRWPMWPGPGPGQGGPSPECLLDYGMPIRERDNYYYPSILSQGVLSRLAPDVLNAAAIYFNGRFGGF